MKRLSPRAARPLKAFHLLCVVLWMGGVAAWLPLVFAWAPGNDEAARTTYLNLRAIAWNVIGWGGIGSFFSGLAMGGLTTWGLFKKPWTVVKLVMTVGGVLFGMFYLEAHMLRGLEMLQGAPAGAATGAEFLAHHAAIQRGLVVQLLVFTSITLVAVFKPGAREPV